MSRSIDPRPSFTSRPRRRTRVLPAIGTVTAGSGSNGQPGRLGGRRSRGRAASAARGRRSAPALRLRLGAGVLALERSPPRLGQRILDPRATRLSLDSRALGPRRPALAIRPGALGALTAGHDPVAPVKETTSSSGRAGAGGRARPSPYRRKIPAWPRRDPLRL